MSNKIKTLSGITKSLVNQYKEYGSLQYVQTGFHSLDSIIGKTHLKELCCIGARHGMGKTALLINIAFNVACTNGMSVYIFSKGLTSEEIVLRMLSLQTESNSSEIAQYLTDKKESAYDKQEVFDNKLGIFEELNIRIIDSAFTINETECIVREQISPSCIIFLDSLQEYDCDVNITTRKLKELARETNNLIYFPICVPRSPQNRINERPMLSDIENGIVKYCDTILLMFRKSYTACENIIFGSDINDVEIIPYKSAIKTKQSAFLIWNNGKYEDKVK